MIVDHLGSVRTVIRDSVGSDYIIRAQYDYEPFGDVIYYSGKEKSRNTYIGKEKDHETMLGDYRAELADHGVRKYESFSGRFMQTEPLWEKYYGWSPYVYSLNNPVNVKDIDGKDIIVLIAPDGANGMGHMAVLIEYEKGWKLYSHNGGTSSSGLKGESSSDMQVGVPYETLDDFIGDPDDDQQRYEFGYRIKSDEETDKKMAEVAAKRVQADYNLFTANCSHVAGAALSVGGFDPGNMISYPFFGLFKYVEPPHPKPNVRYRDIKKNNPGEEIDLNPNEELETKKED